MSSFKIAAIVQLHCLSSAMRVFHPTYHFYSNVYAGHQSCISLKYRSSHLFSILSERELCGRIQFTALHSLLKAKNVAWLSLINMDLAHTNCYHSILESPSFP